MPKPGDHRRKSADSQAVDHIDLLTVVEHELGHIVGLSDNNGMSDDLMDGVPGVNVRRTASHADAVLASV
jgi:predicted Zn-dependent protease